MIRTVTARPAGDRCSPVCVGRDLRGVVARAGIRLALRVVLCGLVSTSAWSQDSGPVTETEAVPEVQKQTEAAELPHPETLDLTRWTGDMPDYYGRVLEHRDGDTFEVDWFTEDEMGVRLKGVDTPETGRGRSDEQRWGAQAAAYAERRLPPGTIVRLDFAGEITGRFGRLLAYVWYWNGERWVSWQRELLEAGMAFVYADYPFERPREFLRYQARAIRAGRGMWARPELIENDVVRNAGELAERESWFREWSATRQ